MKRVCAPAESDSKPRNLLSRLPCGFEFRFGNNFAHLTKYLGTAKVMITFIGPEGSLFRLGPVSLFFARNVCDVGSIHG